MNITSDQSSTNLIEPSSNRNRRASAIVVIAVVLLGLLVSIFTQPFGDLPRRNSNNQTYQDQSGATDPIQNEDQNIGSENNIAKLLLWIGQIVISFIALLASVSELAGINIRELFISRSSKTSVEEFPFLLINDFDRLVDYLFPDPKKPILPDRSINYIPQISSITDMAYQQPGYILIRGRSKTGKTREAIELLKRWWYTGPTVLVARTHVDFFPPFKIPENLPTRNIVLLFDDLDRYFDGSDAAKRFDATIHFFQNLCRDREELKIIATVRQEDEFWRKLGFDKGSSPWDKFELIQLEPLHAENAKKLIVELANSSGIVITPEQTEFLSQKNDGTFLNLLLTFRGWANQNISSTTDEKVQGFEGVLLKTWRRRYEQLVQISSVNKPIYASIDFMQTYGIPLVPSTIKEIATEFFLGKISISLLGLFDRLRNWAEMTQLLNWYRDPIRKRKSVMAFMSIGVLLAYAFLYFLLCLLPGNTQTRIYEYVSNNFFFILIISFPIWVLIVFFILYANAGVLQFFAFRKVGKGLDQLIATEIPLRGNRLRPYEGQFEGNGSSNNWNTEYYSASRFDRKFHKQVGQRLIIQYLNWAEQFRLEGEYPAARNLTRLAVKFSPKHPAPLFLLGKIELEEGNFQEAIDLFSASQSLYGNSSMMAYAAEQLTLAYLYLEQYKSAEETADKALTYMPSLRLARWALGIAKIKNGNLSEGVKQCQIASKKLAIPLEIKKIAETKGFTLEEWYVNIKEHKPSRQRANKSIAGRLWSKIAPLAISIIAIPLVLFCSLASAITFSESEVSLKVFPNSPSLHALRGDKIYFQSWNPENTSTRDSFFQSAIDSYTEAIRLDPQYAYAYVRRGFVQRNLEDYDKAIRYDPDYAYAYFMRGDYYIVSYNNHSETGSISKAIEDYTKAIQLNPKYDEAYTQRGSAFEELGEIDKAISDYESAIRLNSDPSCRTVLCWTTAINLDNDNADYFLRRANAYEYTSDEPEKAIADYTEALRLDPDKIYVYFQRGHIYYDLSEYKKAAADYLVALRAKPDEWLSCFRQYGNNDLCISIAIQLNPNLADAYAYRGDIYNQNGRLALAISDYSDAIRLNSQYKTPAYKLRSQLYTEFRDYEKAIEDYTEIISENPDLAPLYYFDRGDAYFELGKNENAYADYAEGIRIDSSNAYLCGNIQCWSAAIQFEQNNPFYYFSRAQLYVEIGDLDKAIKDYTIVTSLDAQNAGAYLERGHAYNQIGENKKAIADYSESIRLDPENDLAYTNRGYTYYTLGDNEKALGDFLIAFKINPSQINWWCDNLPCWNAAVQLYPNAPSYLIGRGNVYIRIGDYENALADYKKAIQINPEEAYKVCSTIYCWNAAVDLFPTDSMVYYKRGEYYKGLGMFDKAISDFAQAAQLNPNDYGIFMQLGDVYNTLGDTDNAILNYTEAVRNGLTTCTSELCWTIFIQLYPNSALGYMGRGDFYRISGEYSKAIDDYKKALQVEPNNNSARSLYIYLGDMYNTLGEYDTAITHYNNGVYPVLDMHTPCLSRFSMQPFISRGDLYKRIGDEKKANSDYMTAINYYSLEIDCTSKYISNRFITIENDFYINLYIAEMFIERGFVYTKLGESDKALSDYSAAIDYYVQSIRFGNEEAPTYIGTGYLKRCTLYYQLGKYKEAVSDCTKSILFNPYDPAVYYQRGLAYQTLGKQGEANLDFQKYEELRDPR